MRQTGFSSYHLKIIAIIAMTLDHIGVAFEDQLSFWPHILLLALGGLTFPIMAFLLSEGYRYTRSLRGYALRLLGFGMASIVPFTMATGMRALSIMFTLLLGLLTLYLYDHMRNRLAFWLAFALITCCSAVCDWYFTGIAIILAYHALKGSAWRYVVPAAIIWIFAALPLWLNTVVPPGTPVVSTLLYGLTGFEEATPGAPVTSFLPLFVFYVLGSLAVIPLLAHYNGQRGRPAKYLFYVYYPLHLSLIVVARGLLFGQWAI